jgi:hypothetical protein
VLRVSLTHNVPKKTYPPTQTPNIKSAAAAGPPTQLTTQQTANPTGHPSLKHHDAADKAFPPHDNTMAPKETVEMYDHATPSTEPHAIAAETAPVEAVNATEASDKAKTKKRLRWSTITVHEFGVGLGGSSVPSKGGPSIGLADAPEFTWTTKVGEMAERSEGIHRFTSEERVRLLQAAGVSDGMILRFSRETNIILSSRKRTHTEDVEARRAKKRKAENMAALERPCSAFAGGRPRMIPANYV